MPGQQKFMKKEVLAMPKINRPEWGAKVSDALWRMRLPKTRLAAMLGVNYTDMCNVISGHREDAKMQSKIVMKVNELENELKAGAN